MDKDKLDSTMDMTMDVYEVNDLRELWETDLEVSCRNKSKNYEFLFDVSDNVKAKFHVGGQRNYIFTLNSSPAQCKF